MTVPTLTDGRPISGSLIGAVLVSTYAILFSATAAGWLVPGVRVVNVLLMAVLIALWVRSLTRGMDAVDGASIVAVIATGVASVWSIVPRLSAEALFAGLAFAAVFGLVRRMSAGMRDTMLRAIALVGSVVVMAFLVWWASAWVEWVLTTGRPPTLEMALPGRPFGQRHDVALLVSLLAPATFVFVSGRRAAQLAVGAFVAMSAAVVFMSGGRAVWLGAAVATMVVVVTSGRARVAAGWARHRWAWVAGIGLIVVVVVVVSGIGASLAARVFATESLGMRGAIWGSTLADWSDRTLIGSGPGMFQFALQGTNYFDQSVFAPKHADNLYLQTLGELGILGSLALIVLVLAIVRSWRHRRPSGPAVWALVFAAVAGIGANPAALGYCAVLIVFWAGISTPWSPISRRQMPSWIGVAAPAFLAIVAAVPIVTTTGAAFAFDRAREQADRGSLVAATAALDEAVRLDPTFPLYLRERGIMRLRNGHRAAAISDLVRVTGLNPLDDTAFRALALAKVDAGRADDALTAARRAADLRGTNPMNQAVLALVADAAGAAPDRDAALALMTAMAPWSAADPAWEASFPSVDPAQSVRRAAELISSHPVADTVDQRWTVALGGAVQATDPAAYSSAQRAFAHLVACRPEEALRVVEEATAADRVDSNFAFTRAVVLQLNGEPVDPVAPPADPLAGPALGDPVGDQARYTRRSPQPWEGIRLPSDNGGRLAWLDDPERALRLTRGAPCP